MLRLHPHLLTYQYLYLYYQVADYYAHFDRCFYSQIFAICLPFFRFQYLIEFLFQLMVFIEFSVRLSFRMWKIELLIFVFRFVLYGQTLRSLLYLLHQ